MCILYLQVLNKQQKRKEFKFKTNVKSEKWNLLPWLTLSFLCSHYTGPYFKLFVTSPHSLLFLWLLPPCVPFLSLHSVCSALCDPPFSSWLHFNFVTAHSQPTMQPRHSCSVNNTGKTPLSVEERIALVKSTLAQLGNAKKSKSWLRLSDEEERAIFGFFKYKDMERIKHWCRKHVCLKTKEQLQETLSKRLCLQTYICAFCSHFAHVEFGIDLICFVLLCCVHVFSWKKSEFEA